MTSIQAPTRNKSEVRPTPTWSRVDANMTCIEASAKKPTYFPSQHREDERKPESDGRLTGCQTLNSRRGSTSNFWHSVIIPRVMATLSASKLPPCSMRASPFISVSKPTIPAGSHHNTLTGNQDLWVRHVLGIMRISGMFVATPQTSTVLVRPSCFPRKVGEFRLRPQQLKVIHFAAKPQAK
jgi:hypothetical protein